MQALRQVKVREMTIACKIPGLLLRECKRHLLFFVVCIFAAQAFANNDQQADLPFASGEQLFFDIHYRWGIIMAKAGTASYSMHESECNFKPAYCSTLSFRTGPTFDKIFKIRDTLYSYVNMNLEPVYHKKFLNEGNTHYTEALVFVKFGKEKTEATSTRYNSDGSVRFEKKMEASSVAFDMVSIFMFIRTLDYDKLTPGTVFSMSTFVGRDNVKMKTRYVGQVILEKSGNQQYKALKFEVDIVDNAFSTNKSALEMWVGDDANRYPLRIKARLKIGAAEANLTSFKGNKHPLSSLIEIKSK
jgi:hypothetical protein